MPHSSHGDDDVLAPPFANRAPRKKAISLKRPLLTRKALWIAGATVGVAAVVVAGVVFIPKLLVPQLPAVQAAPQADRFQDAIERFENDEGAYPSSVDDLVAANYLAPVDDIQYQVSTNEDGTAYVAGLSDYTVGYVAFTSEHDRGEGATMRDALTDAGWTEQWASDEGFGNPPVIVKEFGGLAVVGRTVTTVVTSLETGEYIVTVTELPRVGEGGTWEDAARAAGADPAAFAPKTDGKPATASADAGELTVAKRDDTWLARFEPAPSKKATAMVLETALAEAGVEDVGATGSFVCATSFDELGIHSATGCRTSEGVSPAWATTGADAASSDVLEAALGAVGATQDWYDEHGVTAPTYDDLF